jgi:predicted component of type VI protein secretion system
MTQPSLFICRLFNRDRPFEPIDSRMFASGQMTIGRDPAADWVIPDDEGVLSRTHCVLAVEDGRVMLSDQSTNGTFLETGERAPRGIALELMPRDCIHLGPFSILIDHAEPAPGADVGLTQLHGSAPPPRGELLPKDWSDSSPVVAHRDASLLEAFCEGARLDASALSSEDPVDLMRKIGAIYQQTILGLSTLMAERAKMKSDHQLDRTTIGAADNNPFKWAPTKKLAHDLLLSGNQGFLPDAQAVRSSFEDLSQHLHAMTQGAKGSIDLTMQALSPIDIDAEARSQGALLRSRAALCWEIFAKRYAELERAGRDTPMNRAFAQGYDQSSEAKAQ